MYRPLPPEVTIRQSCIDGLGLFAACDMEKGHRLGITHIANDNFENQYIRTPLGGFINHSNTANCTLIKTNPSLELSDNGGDAVLVLVTKQLIVANTELTTYYSLYKISEEETL
tara:strand:+ start:248 stop:589 length:342 start_codon:yes stop_codon:yes gene_type:complete